MNYALFVAGILTAVSLSSQTPPVPTREYIYLGGRLVAIENSAATAPDFTFTAAQSSQTTPAGGSAQFTLSVAALNGFGGVVTFSAGSAPAGWASPQFSPASVTATGTTTATVQAPSTAAAGSYSITVTAASAGLSTKQISLTVQVPAPDFAFTAAVTSQTAGQGGAAVFGLQVTAEYGFSGVVTFSASSVPAGWATPQFSPASVTGAGTATATVPVPSTAAVGSYTVTVTAASAGLSTKQITLTVNVVQSSPATIAWSTGVADASGNLLADAVTDPHYTVNGTPAVVTYSTGYPIGPWMGIEPGAKSKWISTQANAGLGVPAGDYVFQTTFSLSGYTPSSVTLTGKVAADNDVQVKLNGSVINATPFQGFGAWSNFTIGPNSALFLAGVNTLELVVKNYWNGYNNPMGLRAELSITGTLTPPPSVTIFPQNASVNAGGTPVDFQATASDNARVTWSQVSGPGTMVETGFQTGRYTPPASVASPQTARVRATHPVNTSVWTEATVTVNVAQAPGTTIDPVFSPWLPWGPNAVSNWFRVNAPDGVGWTAMAPQPGYSWLSLFGYDTGTGPGIVQYLLQPNTGSLDRTGPVWVNGGALVHYAQQRAGNQVPATGTVTATNYAGMGATFTATYSDSNGAGDLKYLDLLISSEPVTANWQSACWVEYDKGTGKFFLFDDYTWTFLELVSGTTVENARCKLTSASAATPSANSVTLTVALTFKTAFTGTRGVFSKSEDLAGTSTGWVFSGGGYAVQQQLLTVQVQPIGGWVEAAPGGTVQVNAMVYNYVSNNRVTWSPVTRGSFVANASQPPNGIIYTAPANVTTAPWETVYLTATSQEDPSKAAQMEIRVVPPPPSVWVENLPEMVSRYNPTQVILAIQDAGGTGNIDKAEMDFSTMAEGTGQDCHIVYTADPVGNGTVSVNPTLDPDYPAACSADAYNFSVTRVGNVLRVYLTMEFYQPGLRYLHLWARNRTGLTVGWIQPGTVQVQY